MSLPSSDCPTAWSEYAAGRDAIFMLGNPPRSYAAPDLAAASPPEADDTESLELMNRTLKAWEAFCALADEWADVIEIPDEVYAEQERLVRIADDLRTKAISLPVHTLAGLRMKARLVMTMLNTAEDGSMPPEREGYAAFALCRDLIGGDDA